MKMDLKYLKTLKYIQKNYLIHHNNIALQVPSFLKDKNINNKPTNKAKHSTLLHINWTYEKKLYPQYKRFK